MIGEGEVCKWGHEYPLVPITIHFQGQKHGMKVMFTHCLTHPLILEKIWSECSWMVPCINVAVCDMCSSSWGGGAWTISNCSQTEIAKEWGKPCPLVTPIRDFPPEQSQDESLRHTFNQLRVINCQLVQWVSLTQEKQKEESSSCWCQGTAGEFFRILQLIHGAWIHLGQLLLQDNS